MFIICWSIFVAGHHQDSSSLLLTSSYCQAHHSDHNHAYIILLLASYKSALVLYLSLLLLIVKFNLDLDWLLYQRTHQFRLCVCFEGTQSKVQTWTEYSLRLDLHISRQTLLTTPLPLLPNIKTYDNLVLCIVTENVLLKIRLCMVFHKQNFRTVIIHYQFLILFHQSSIGIKDFRLFVNIKLRLGIIITVFTLPSNTEPCTNVEKLGLSKHHRRFRTFT